MDSQIKQAYTAPRLVEYGRVEDITRGNGSSWQDALFGQNGGWFPPYDDHHHDHTSS